MQKQQSLRPSSVSIPLHNPSTKYYDLAVAIGERVLVGQKIAVRYNQEVRLPVFSSVSGVVKSVNSLEYVNGISMDHLVIENDTLEERAKARPLMKPYTPQMLRTHLVDMGVEGLDQSDLYTALDFTGNIKQVIVNAVYENAGFVKEDVQFFESNQDAIVMGCYLLAQTSLQPVTVLTNSRAFATKCQQAGLRVRVVRPRADKAWQVQAIRQIIKQQPPYDLLSVGVVYTNAHTAKAVYDAVEQGVPVTSTEVVLLVDDAKKQRIVEAKIGTSVADILDELKTPLGSQPSWFQGNVLSGSTMKSGDFVVHAQASTIGVTSKVITEDVCIKCGICNDVCPVGILPQNIMDSEIRIAEDRIYNYSVDQCVECGLCSYVCPSEINVLEWVRRAKRRVARGVE
jgi:electron transport complex protein RnfC